MGTKVCAAGPGPQWDWALCLDPIHSAGLAAQWGCLGAQPLPEGHPQTTDTLVYSRTCKWRGRGGPGGCQAQLAQGLGEIPSGDRSGTANLLGGPGPT